MTIDDLRTQRMNKLLEMTSQCDQCLKHGFYYEPHEIDLELIYRLDDEILNRTKNVRTTNAIQKRIRTTDRF